MGDRGWKFSRDDTSALFSPPTTAPASPAPPNEADQAGAPLRTLGWQLTSSQRAIRDASRRHKVVMADLQMVREDLKVENDRRAEAERINGQIQQAKCELADANIKAQKVDEALHWMQCFFTQENGHMDMLEHLASESQSAARRKEDALAKVQRL